MSSASCSSAAAPCPVAVKVCRDVIAFLESLTDEELLRYPTLSDYQGR
jgi:hypothetical protein